MKKVILLSVLFSYVGISQQQTPSSYPFSVSAQQGVTNIGAQVTGSKGVGNYYYWVVANRTAGQMLISPFVQVANAPNVLSGGNFVTVFWNSVAGATSYDVLRTTTSNAPNVCTCAVTTGSTANSFNDTGAGLSSYTYAPVGNVNGSISLDNSGASPRFLFNPSIPGGASVAATPNALKGDNAGNAIAVTGNATDCVKVNGTSGTCGSGTPGGSAGQIQFNNSGSFGGFTASGDVTVNTGTGAVTLSTVNSGPGACGDGTHVCAVTTDGKGRVTAQSAVAITGTSSGQQMYVTFDTAGGTCTVVSGPGGAACTAASTGGNPSGPRVTITHNFGLASHQIPGGWCADSSGIEFSTNQGNPITDIRATSVNAEITTFTSDAVGNCTLTTGGIGAQGPQGIQGNPGAGVGSGAAGQVAYYNGTTTVIGNPNYTVGGGSNSDVTLGLAGTAVGTVSFANATSGTIKIQPPTGALGSGVLTLPVATGILGYTVYTGTATLGTSAIAANTCATTVTVSASGVATTDVISYSPNADISAATGYGVASTDGLIIYPFPTANNINFKVCNATGLSITPSAVTLNARVAR